MSISILSLLLLTSQQRITEGLPKFEYAPAVVVGQREVVLGPQLVGDTMMEVRFDADIPAQIGEGRIAPPVWKEYSKGYVRWSVTDGTLFNKPCRILKMDGITNGENRTKLKKIQYASRNSTTWWIQPDGKLLRQSVKIDDPDGVRHAECIYWPDHLEVSVADGKNSRSFSLYPNIDLTLLDAQFKPMIEGSKVLTQSKDYYIFDPFTQAFLKYKATVNGTFHGTWLATKFEGINIAIEGPKDRQVVFISKENDLIKVELPPTTSIVLDNLPPSRDPFFKVMNKGSGGSKE